MVFGTAVRLLGDPSEAEDVSQTVFLRAFERSDTLLDNPAAPGWLRTVTTNLCLNHLKRFRSRFRLFSQRRRSEGGGSGAWEDSADDTESPADRLERTQRREQLEQALRSLPSSQRVPLVLFHFQQRSYREIAALLGISLSKVKSDMFRGRQALRHLMEANDDPR